MMKTTTPTLQEHKIQEYFDFQAKSREPGLVIYSHLQSHWFDAEIKNAQYVVEHHLKDVLGQLKQGGSVAWFVQAGELGEAYTVCKQWLTGSVEVFDRQAKKRNYIKSLGKSQLIVFVTKAEYEQAQIQGIDLGAATGMSLEL